MLQGLVLGNASQHVVDVLPQLLLLLSRFLYLSVFQVACELFRSQLLLTTLLLQTVDPKLVVLGVVHHLVVSLIQIVLVLDFDLNTVGRPSSSLEEVPRFEVDMLVADLSHFVLQ